MNRQRGFANARWAALGVLLLPPAVAAEIRGQERDYGTTTLYLKTESKQGLSRTAEWTDVWLRRGDAGPVNVSRCDGVNCGQPALSPDGRRVAFVKAGDRE
jgi:hypothetical protein